jgi:RHS repeat-associated protein
VCATPCYDALGNLLILPDRRPAAANAPPPPPLKFKYDLLSSMTNFDAAQIGRSFIYDADGERVAIFDYKTADNTLHELWSMRGVDKHVLRDFDRSGTAYTWSAVKDYVYRGSILSSTVLPGEALRDVHVDHLGSTRLITDATGAPIVVARVPAYDSHGDPILDAQHNQVYNDIKDAPRKYWPFGELKVIRPLGDRMAFTGHERDDDGSANGAAALDYMHARYYTATLGRFLSVDRMSGHSGKPQSWNRYTYVENNPVNAVDLMGLVMGTMFGKSVDVEPGYVGVLTFDTKSTEPAHVVTVTNIDAKGNVWVVDLQPQQYQPNARNHLGDLKSQRLVPYNSNIPSSTQTWSKTNLELAGVVKNTKKDGSSFSQSDVTSVIDSVNAHGGLTYSNWEQGQPNTHRVDGALQADCSATCSLLSVLLDGKLNAAGWTLADWYKELEREKAEEAQQEKNKDGH